MKAFVTVMPKSTVLDPQGVAVRNALRHVGLEQVSAVRVGRFIEIELEGDGPDQEARLHEICRDLLSNPVIEDYRIEIAK